MKKIIVVISVVFLMIGCHQKSNNEASTFPGIPDLKWSKRLAVQVVNPGDASYENIPITVPVTEFQLDKMPFLEMGHFRVKDSITGKIQPYQVDDLNGDGTGADEIVFMCSLQPSESRMFYIDFFKSFKAWPQQIRYTDATSMPGWESELFGYRSYGHFVVDMFGKYKSNPGLRLKTFYNESNKQIYNYHVDSETGMDILHVGATIGLGGIGLYDGEKLALPSSGNLDCKVIASGPVRSIVKISKQWENGIGIFKVNRTVSIYAHHFETEITDTLLTIKLKRKTNARFCTGIKKEDGMDYFADTKKGMFLVWFHQDMYDIGDMGMGLILKNMEQIRIDQDEANNLFLWDKVLAEKEMIVTQIVTFGAWARADYIKNMSEFKQFAGDILNQEHRPTVKILQQSSTID